MRLIKVIFLRATLRIIVFVSTLGDGRQGGVGARAGPACRSFEPDVHNFQIWASHPILTLVMVVYNINLIKNIP